jgi:hypothetical protein
MCHPMAGPTPKRVGVLSVKHEISWSRQINILYSRKNTAIPPNLNILTSATFHLKVFSLLTASSSP